MKKVLLFFSMLVFQLVLFAQEATEQIEEDKGWSNETKSYILAVFILFNIILVLRTFRNKPSA